MNKQADEYEVVTAITRLDQEIKVGDKLTCSCEYEVVELYPVWHSDTKKYFKEHSANTFSCRVLISDTCLIHMKIK